MDWRSRLRETLEVMVGQESLQSEVERLVYSADETGYSICRLKVPGSQDLVSVVGDLPGIQPGERLSLEGRWLNHPKYCLQFQASRYSYHLPVTANAIKRYLISNLVKGIGPVMAGRLVDRFGDESLQVIEEPPQRLSEIRGIGPHRIKNIQGAWEEQREVREMMLFLQGHGVSSTYATRLEKHYYPDMNRQDLVDHPAHHIYLKLAIDGKTSRLLSAYTRPPFHEFQAQGARIRLSGALGRGTHWGGMRPTGNPLIRNQSNGPSSEPE